MNENAKGAEPDGSPNLTTTVSTDHPHPHSPIRISHRVHSHLYPTQTDDAPEDEDEGEEEEDEAEGVDDGQCEMEDDSVKKSHPPSTFAPSLKSHPYLPGVSILDVPGLRIDGPCYRSCCVRNSTREWLRVNDSKTPLLAPALVPGGDRVAIFGVPESSAASGSGFHNCSETEKMWVKFGGIKNNACKAAFKTAGFRVLKETVKESEMETTSSSPTENSADKSSSDVRSSVKQAKTGPGNFNVCWNGALKKGDFEKLNPYQRVNHFPGTWELGRKDKLGRNVEKARRRRPEEFNFLPKSWVLPKDVDEWRLDRKRNKNAVYIVKPPASSRGRGVRMLKPSEANAMEKKKVLIQRYISDPHLLDGYKYDLRVYVVVTSIDPLRVYLYKEGLVRLATEKYSEGGRDLTKRCMHLTNYSVNSKKEKFVMGDCAVGQDDVGFKRSLSSLRKRFERDGVDFETVIWREIKDVVTKTLLSVDTNMNVRHKIFIPGSNQNACYELFGFDVMLDSKLKPWLIEVNTGPSLSAPANLDIHIKHKMVANVFNLVGVAPYDKNKVKRESIARRKARLMGVGGSGTSTTRHSVSASGVRPNTNSRPVRRGFASRPNTPVTDRGCDQKFKSLNSFPTKRDVRSLRGLDFSHFGVEDLPQVIRDAEGELARAGAFDRCFPTEHPDTNAKYLDLFETQRYDNVLLCAWERYKFKLGVRMKNGPSAVASRNSASARSVSSNTSRSSSSSESSRGGSASVGTVSRNGSARGPGRDEYENRSSNHFGTKPPLGASRVTKLQSSPPPTGVAADVDALASSIARGLGVADGRLERGRDSLSFRATRLLSSARDDARRKQPTFVRDMVKSASRGSRSAAIATVLPPSRDQLTTLGIVGSGGGQKQVRVPDSVLACARRR